jgi:uncharacterized protein GlcG (DUF336 family)
MTRTPFLSISLAGCLLAAHAQAANLPMKVALEAAQAAVESCKASGYNITVTILDADMTTRIVLRGDASRDGTVQVSYRKAYTVLKSGMTSGEFGKTVKDVAPVPAGSLPGPVNGDPNLITWAGGLPIKVDGEVVGAMSASGAPGGEKDEACVRAGFAKIPGAAK